VPTNHGQAEEVLAQNPDLVLAGTFTASTTRALISRFDYNVVEVPEAFYAMLSLTDGEFALDPAFKPTSNRIGLPTESLLLEGMRRLDEATR
jgi:hypothetical protein